MMDRIEGYTVILSVPDLLLAASATRRLLELASRASTTAPSDDAGMRVLRGELAQLARSQQLLDLASDLYAHANRARRCSGAGTAEQPPPEDMAPSPHDHEPRLTVAEAAEVLGISTSLARRWCRDGRLSGAVKDRAGWTVDASTVADVRLTRHEEHDDVE